MFDIYNINTYDEAPDDFAIIEGEFIYDKNCNPIKWQELTAFIKALLKFLNRNENKYILTKEQLILFLHRFTKNYKTELETISPIDYTLQNITENSNYVFINDYNRDSNMTDYVFSLAQREFTKFLSEEIQLKLKSIIIKHFNLCEKKYRLQQDIFDNHISIDNYLFTDLCYCSSLKEEQDIMYEYFTSFDDLQSIKKIDEVLNNPYLNQYPVLKKEIKESLIKYQLN